MPTYTVMMPRELTAENGAKALLIGEFQEYTDVHCDCIDENGNSHEECAACAGTGFATISVPVSWTTIKDIYAMAVKHLGK